MAIKIRDGGAWVEIVGGSSGGVGSGATDKIQEGNTLAEVVDTGSDGHFKVEIEGTERLRVKNSGELLLKRTDTSLEGGHLQFENKNATEVYAIDVYNHTGEGTDADSVLRFIDQATLTDGTGTQRFVMNRSGAFGIGHVGSENYGTSGQVLTSQGENSQPIWSSAPTDISDLTDTGGTIPTDISDLTDTGGAIPTDISDLTDTGGAIPTNTSDLTNGAGFIDGITIKDEGSTLSTKATTLNFVGSGVVASGTGSEKTITINAISQPVTFQWTGTTSTSSLAFQNTGLTQSITPSSTSKKVLVMAHFYGDDGGGELVMSIDRTIGGTTTNLGSAGTLNSMGQLQGTSVDAIQTLVWLDSPSTTSSTTYTVIIKRSTASATTVSIGLGRASSIVLWEV